MKKIERIVSCILIFSIMLSVFTPIVVNAENQDTNVKITLSSPTQSIVENMPVVVVMSIECGEESIDTIRRFRIIIR